MEVCKVSLDDGRRCAVLINLLRSGRWDLSGADAEELVRVKVWVQSLAQLLASQLSPTPNSPAAPEASPAASPAGGFRVKSIGSLGPVQSSGRGSSKKKRKK